MLVLFGCLVNREEENFKSSLDRLLSLLVESLVDVLVFLVESLVRIPILINCDLIKMTLFVIAYKSSTKCSKLGHLN